VTAVASGRFAAVAVATLLLAGCGEQFPPPPQTGDSPVASYREERRQENEDALERAARSERAEERRERAARLRRERAEDRARRAEAEDEPAEEGLCAPAYEQCLPIRRDLNCDDIDEADKPIKVKDPDDDPYELDRENDGVACEPNP